MADHYDLQVQSPADLRQQATGSALHLPREEAEWFIKDQDISASRILQAPQGYPKRECCYVYRSSASIPYRLEYFIMFLK
jgi:hypothetical protein